MIGFVNVNKPSGLTSSTVVSILKRVFKTKKIGHLGTLDPMAEGVLPIAIGKATRMFDYFLNKQKTYVAEFTFGVETDTLDGDGEIISKTNEIPTKEDIEKILNLLTGEINQIPPQYSAKKVNGRAAYDIARSGGVVELKPKLVTIYSIKLISQLSNNTFRFEIVCSGGTYIRSIARDMAKLLNSKAIMSKLVRTKSGKFDLSNAYTIEQLKQMEHPSSILVNIEDIFDFPVVILTEKQTKDLLDGKFLKVDKKDNEYFIKCDTILIGIASVKDSVLKLKTYLREDND